MDYKDFLQKKTFDKLNQKSKESLQQMLGDKALMRVLMESQELLAYISQVEKDYIPELEALAVDIVKKLYPIIEREDITIDAKIVTEVNPSNDDEEDGELDFSNVEPEIKRRIINGISQGASIRGAFAFHLFDDNLNKINDTLIGKYGALLKSVFGIYDSDEAIAMLLAALAQGQKQGGGESEVEVEDDDITIRAEAINFPILLHEIVKGLFELISLQGFRGLGANQAKQVAGSVDKLSNEPHDLRYGKFIYDALNDLINQSGYDNPTVKEYFFAEVYQLDSDEFLPFIENLVNDELTSSQRQWVQSTIKDIEDDIKADDYDDLGIDESIRPILRERIQSLLKEYSEKFINDTIERWQQDDPNINPAVAKKLIQRFDQVKQGLNPEILPLSDKLKQKKNYLNLDLYSYDDLEKVIRAVPEKEKNVKKQAVSRFVEKFDIDKPTALSYVSRFLANKDNLKFGFKDGIPELNLSAEEIQNFIPDNLRRNNNFLDPRLWKWNDFEQILDAVFPSQKRVSGEEGGNDATTNADKIYDKDGLEIYKGDDINKCISYNPTLDSGRKKYGWCVTQPGNTMYDTYRFREDRPTFYFVFDRTRPSTPNHTPFDDVWHAYVIQIKTNGTYMVTAADNRGDIDVKTWEEIPVKTGMDSQAWDRIKDKKDYFKPIALSSVERGRLFASGKTLNLDEFKELTTQDKILYVQGKASKNKLDSDILEVLPKFPKIKLDGRSTTLVNVAIDSGQEFPYKALEDSQALAKRYAIFRFRHTNYSKNPIPLYYIQYLDTNAKKKYLEQFEDNVTFEYVEKFFGEDFAKEYVNNQVKTLDYLPPVAIKYIDDDNLKKLYTIYNKLTSNWEFSDTTNVSDEELKTLKQMPPQEVTPNYITYKNLNDFSSGELNVIINLVKKYNKNPKFSTLLYALPFVVENQGKSYLLVPKNSDFNEWVLVSPEKQIVKQYKGELSYGDEYINSGYYIDYSSDTPSVDRILDLDKLQIQ